MHRESFIENQLYKNEDCKKNGLCVILSVLITVSCCFEGCLKFTLIIHSYDMKCMGILTYNY